MIVTIVIASTLGTIGSPGMPGVVMVTLVTVLQSVGFPLDAVAIIVGIDRFTDMFKTVVNVFGDAVCTTVVSKSENEFDQEVFDGIKEPEEELAEIVM
ncbi:MAG: dicarboxylate/amino acid:cation symporter [Firmicutes bacterium]|nr:dicarboxylate/amino acid:cation symporter [Bacillota bacterium]